MQYSVKMFLLLERLLKQIFCIVTATSFMILELKQLFIKFFTLKSKGASLHKKKIKFKIVISILS